MKSTQSVREEPSAAVTVQVLVEMSTEEQLEGEGETPRRPGRGEGGRGERRGVGRGVGCSYTLRE